MLAIPEWLGLNLLAWLDLLPALDHDTVARLQPTGDHPHSSHTLADLNLPNCHPVVSPDHIHLVATLKLAHRWLGNEQGALVLSGHGAHHRVLARTQDVAGIRKQGRHLDRASAGIHLTISKREPAVLRMR